MTGQLALPFVDPIPVVEAHHRAHARRSAPPRYYGAPMRRPYMWWRGRRRDITNVPLALAGAL